jgi:hypothetical protein
VLLQPDEWRRWFRRLPHRLLVPWTKFVDYETAAALLRGAQPSDFEARVVQLKQLVRVHGALRGLTFELSGRNRLAAPAREYLHWLEWPAGGGPLERRVRQQAWFGTKDVARGAMVHA